MVLVPFPTHRARRSAPTGDVSAFDFERQVRDALRHLYDPVHLQRHPLTVWVRRPDGAGPADEADWSCEGAALRQSLLEAIVALQPPDPLEVGQSRAQQAGNRAWRRHRLLVLRYVEGHDIPAVCAALAVSRREYERTHREGLDAIVAYLQSRWPAVAGPAEPATASTPLARAAGSRRGLTGEAGAVPGDIGIGRADAGPLPVPLTSFIGRERQAADVMRLLQTARLVTITGPGGVGKTRLALHVAQRLGHATARRVVWVSLVAVGDPDLALPTIARALGVREPAAETLAQGIGDLVRQDAVLLVLDNFEHLLDASPVVAELLAVAEQIRVLATSRAALRVSGEQEYPLAPLTVPRPRLSPSETPPTELDAVADAEAVRLFVERAQAINPGFALSIETASAVAGICRRLDGLPLAIELAAARVRSLPPAALLARLESASGLPLLSAAPRDAPERHQTLRLAMEWSHDLLSPELQATLRRLAVFAGGFTLDAASAVCAVDTETRACRSSRRPAPSFGVSGHDTLAPDTDLVLQRIDELLGHSVLQRHDDAGSDPRDAPRYSMLETVREFALEHLEAHDEADTARQRHVEVDLALANRPEAEQTAAWFDAVEREHENLRAAMRWCMTRGDPDSVERALLLGVALGHLWEFRGYWSQGRQELEWLLAQPMPDRPSATCSWAHATCLTKAGHLAWRQGDHGAARAFYEAGLALRRRTGQCAMVAFSLHSLGELAFEQGDYASARVYHEEAREVRRDRGHRHLSASLTHLGRVLQEQGDDALARGLHEEALDLARHYGGAHILAIVLNDLGRLAWRRGDYVQARTHHDEALLVARELGDRREIAAALDHLGRVAHSQGDLEGAGRCHAEALRTAWEFGDRLRIAWCIEGLAAVAATQGQANEASRLFGAAAALRETLGAPLPPTQRHWRERHLAAARAALGDDTFAAAWRLAKRCLWRSP